MDNENKTNFELIIIGRGGQGGKSASELLAKIAILDKGKYAQSFPDFGAERKGVPVKSYLRVSNASIKIHSGITNPDFIIILDPTLINHSFVDGLKTSGALIVNTIKKPDEIKTEFNIVGKVFALDATKIALEVIGSPHVNTAMVGAAEKAINFFGIENLKNGIKTDFERDFPKEIIEKNLKSLERAYTEVTCSN